MAAGRKTLAPFIAVALLGIAGNSRATDLAPDQATDPWTGLYGGASSAYGFGSANSHSSVIGGAAVVPTPQLPSSSSAPRGGFLGGLQFGYDFRIDRFVLGSELDMSAGAVRSDAIATGVAGASGLPFESAQSSTLDRLATLRGQAGFLPADNLLLYGFGGLAVGRIKNDTGLNFTGGATYDGGRAQTLAGWTAGAGVEYAFAPAWGLKLEYLHYDLGTATADAYRRILSPFHTQADFTVGGDLVRVAVDYHFGDGSDVDETWDNASNAGPFSRAIAALSALRYEIGARDWYGAGVTRYSIHNADHAGLTSRLSYTGLDANAGELFSRIDHPSGLFAKANIGAGSVGGGGLADEDFPPGTTPYSRTESPQRNGALSYVTADVGYTAFDDGSFSVAPFVGYTYYHDQLNAYGCAQTASNAAVCAGASPGVLSISEDADWNAIRLGLDTIWKSPWHGLAIELEGAWIPYGSLNGNDNHWLRMGVPSSESLAGPILQGGLAHGMQLEATVKMPVTEGIDVGLGGRYWYFQSHGQSVFTTTFAGSGQQAADFSTRRAGAFAQVSAHF